jgi:transposase InsO family protein
MTTSAQRQQLLNWVGEAAQAGARQQRACHILGLSERTVQRWQEDVYAIDQRTVTHNTPPHALCEEERREVLAVANATEFYHLPPSQIVPLLADKGRYIASESTFCRILRQEGQLAHRRSARPSQPRHRPKALCATQANHIYSWDITYLPTTLKGQYFYLYAFLDIFSRKLVGWQVYAEESSQHASEMMKDICLREGIVAGQVTLHSDNGSPMKGATMLAMLQTLGVMPSLSRPAVSNDNPYSESVFNTLKHRPAYPLKPMEDLQTARCWAEGLVQWYNHEHRHSSIQFVTPAQRHDGLDQAIIQKRLRVYAKARQAHPNRWSGQVRNWQYVAEVHLNPIKKPINMTKITQEIMIKKAA